MRLALSLFFVLTLPLSVLFRPGVSGSGNSQPVGIKLRTRYASSDGLTSEHTSYWQGDRKRIEYRSATGSGKHWYGGAIVHYGPRMAVISRCDLQKNIDLNLDTQEYAIATMPQFWSAEERQKYSLKFGWHPTPRAAASQPTFEIQTTTRDTGERREFFGHTARHVITMRKEVPLQGSQREAQESVTDGWYIDLDNSISCDLKSRPDGHAFLSARASSDSTPLEIPRFVDVGEPVTGFPVQLKTTSRSVLQRPEGPKEFVSTSETTVLELTEGQLDASLFEVPAGFRQVDRVKADATPPAQQWNQFRAWVHEEWAKLFG